MIERNYLSKQKTKRDQWLTDTYAPSLLAYGAGLGVTPLEIDTVQDAADEARYEATFRGYLDSFSKSVTAFENSMDTADPCTPIVRPIFAPPAPPTPRVSPKKSGDFNFIADLNDRLLKLTPAVFTPEIKTALGLNPLEPGAAKDAKIDELIAKNDGAMEVHFHLFGHKAAEIQMQRSSETDITASAQSAFDVYLDARPNKVAGQVESRGYRVRFVIAQGQFSEWSEWKWSSTKA